MKTHSKLYKLPSPWERGWGRGLFTLCILLTLTATSCKKDKNDPKEEDTRHTYLTKEVSQNIITNITQIRTHVYDQQGRYTSMIIEGTTGLGASFIYKVDYSEFNSHGKPGRSTTLYPGSTSDGNYIIYMYNVNGELTEYRVNNKDGALVERKKYERSNNELVVLVYNSANNLNNKYIYSFDTKGNVTNWLIYSYPGGSETLIQESKAYTFDNKKSLNGLPHDIENTTSVNNVTGYIAVDVEGKEFTLQNSYEYNEDGYPTKRVATNVTAGTTTVITYEYMKR